jgi:hypothetical protein
MESVKLGWRGSAECGFKLLQALQGTLATLLLLLWT